MGGRGRLHDTLLHALLALLVWQKGVWFESGISLLVPCRAWKIMLGLVVCVCVFVPCAGMHACV